MGLWHKYASVAYLAVFVGVIGHASSEFVSVLSGIAGPELSVWRFLLGGTGLVILALIFPATRNLIAPFRTDGLRLVWLSLLGIATGYLFFHWSLDFATVPQVATIVSTAPIFVGLINLWLNKQPFTSAKLISGICALLGVALLITDGYLARLAGAGQNFIGVLMAMGCATLVAMYTVVVRPIIDHLRRLANHSHYLVYGRRRVMAGGRNFLEYMGQSGNAFQSTRARTGFFIDDRIL